MADRQITSVLTEHRVFSPPEAFRNEALIDSLEKYKTMWEHAKNHPEDFWREQALDLLQWDKPFDTVLRGKMPKVEWFAEGHINASVNCLDRHVKHHPDKTALIWEGESGDHLQFSYRDLLSEVSRCANGLKARGVKKGSRVTIYLPMVPELAIAVLACARLGAIHSVIFAGFSADALAERIQDAESDTVITADGVFRRGQTIPLKDQVDQALKKVSCVKCVVVVPRTKAPIHMEKDRDILWQELVVNQSNDCAAESVAAEHPLFILYTSGSTGKPKGVVHSTAGYLLQTALSFKYVFDHRENDIFWCTADVGWITGHSYVIYGPLANGATIMMYEGAPNYPDPSRFWQIIDRYKISILYTAPTAIRAFMKWGDEHIEPYDLSSLRLLGSVGEPINPAAWLWYREKIGKNRCPIVDTWWQTETGGIMISPLPGAIDTAPGSATLPFFGVVPEIVDTNGNPVPLGTGGYLVISQPWPSMIRGLRGDQERFHKTYFEQIPGKYFTGDGARQDKNGYFWILGRIDDVINVSGHRLSTMEIESALVHHPAVAEAAVVGKPDDLKGEVICCFVTLRQNNPSAELKKELREHVAKQIGALARPEEIRFTQSLPKTRSGKIMRRFLRDIARGHQPSGDASTLEDISVLQQISSEGEE